MSPSYQTRNLIMCRCGCIAGVDVHISPTQIYLPHVAPISHNPPATPCPPLWLCRHLVPFHPLRALQPYHPWLPSILLRPPITFVCFARTLPRVPSQQFHVPSWLQLTHLNTLSKLLLITCILVRRVALLYPKSISIS
jgi:hypothetical protein